MALLYLPDKHEDLSLIPRTRTLKINKAQGMVPRTCNPSTEETDRGRPLGLSGQAA